MINESGGRKFRLDLKGLGGIVASVLTIITIVFYFYVHLEQPNLGFLVNGQTGVVLHVSGGHAVDAFSGEALAGGERLQAGDRIIKIGENLFREYAEDLTLPIYAAFQGQDPVPVVFERRGEVQTIHLKRHADSPGALFRFVAFLFPILFWAMGTLTVVFLYPRDDRWVLMVLFQYDTALWLSTGFVSYSHEAYSVILYYIFIALFCPLSVHLHLILPDAPFRNHHRWVLPLVYGAAFILTVLLLYGKITRDWLYGAVLISAVISLMLVVYRVFLPSTPAVRIARRAMLYGLGVGVGPLAALILAYTVNPIGLLASVFDEIILGFFLLVVPIWLCAYIFAIYKHDLGFFEFRANRLLGIYGFFSIFVALYMIVFDATLHWWSSTELLQSTEMDLAVLGLILSLIFVAAGQSFYGKFQRLVDHYIFSIKYKPTEVVGAFAERIPAARNRRILKEVVVDEILPALMIRQSALYLFADDKVEVIYEEGVPAGAHAIPTWSELTALAAQSGRYMRHGPATIPKFSWVRLALSLSIPEKNIGVWFLGKRDPDDYYSKEDVVLLGKLANQIAPVIENFKLVEQARREVEENRKLQEQLIQSQKMEAIGRLSAGVAHDFNNILSVIIGYSNLVMAQYQGDPGLRQSMKNIKDAGERAATLTRQLLAFSRQQVMEAQVTSLNVIVSDVEKMLRRLTGEDVELVTELSPDVPSVRVDPVQMGQVVINLVVNARDAMPEGGRILIRTREVECRIADALFNKGMKPGSYAMLGVEDSGTGIKQDLLSYIFEPYFTTKEKGKGTGLGLSTVYGIINQSKGHIFVDSELGKGTSFEIYFPAAMSEHRQESELPKSKELLTFGTETVLLVEDEDSVRAVTAEILQANGYTVIEAEDGEQAIEKFKQNQQDIDLLLTDVVMPRMRGPDLARRLLEMTPQLKIVYMSGYNEESVVRSRVGDPKSILINKPFSPHKLALAIREVLDGRKVSDRSILSVSV